MPNHPETPLLPVPASDAKPATRVLWRRWADMPVSDAATPVRSSLRSVASAIGMVLLSILALIGFGELVTGRTHASPLVLVMSPIVAFLFAGMAGQGVLHIYAHFAGRNDGGELEARFWRWWSGAVGMGGLKLLAIAIVVLAAYATLDSLFDGLSKGTALIVALLVGILVALATIAARLR